MVNKASSFSGPLQDFPNQFKNRKAKSKLTQKYCMVNIEQAVFQGLLQSLLQDLGGASAQSVTFQDRMAIVILLREIGERRSLLCRLNNRLKRHSQLELI